MTDVSAIEQNEQQRKPFLFPKLQQSMPQAINALSLADWQQIFQHFIDQVSQKVTIDILTAK